MNAASRNGVRNESPRIVVDISHRYGNLQVLDHIAFSVRKNEFICVCGPSGCGKTTLADILAGLKKPTEGSVTLEGAPLDPRVHDVAFVFQEPSALPWLTVRENIGIGLEIKKRPSDEIDRRVAEIVNVVGLGGFEHYYPHQISGGMKQRVAIARAFATDADLILMDEPFVSLDQPTRERMQHEVLAVWQNYKRTIVFVTHNLEEAIFLADRIIVLTQKPATIKADVAVQLPRPRDPLDATFVALRAELVGHLHSEFEDSVG
ncbi:MAG: ABC transporter ATP-binding protein [Vulcanimicrobiaceae bacterium]